MIFLCTSKVLLLGPCFTSPPSPIALSFQEWGNPNESKFHDYMLSYSPYDNVRRQPYPAMLVTGGLNDPRVSGKNDFSGLCWMFIAGFVEFFFVSPRLGWGLLPVFLRACTDRGWSRIVLSRGLPNSPTASCCRTAVWYIWDTNAFFCSFRLPLQNHVAESNEKLRAAKSFFE